MAPLDSRGHALVNGCGRCTRFYQSPSCFIRSAPEPRTRPNVKVSVVSNMAKYAEAVGWTMTAGSGLITTHRLQGEHAARLVIPGITAESPMASGAS